MFCSFLLAAWLASAPESDGQSVADSLSVREVVTVARARLRRDVAIRWWPETAIWQVSVRPAVEAEPSETILHINLRRPWGNYRSQDSCSIDSLAAGLRQEFAWRSVQTFLALERAQLRPRVGLLTLAVSTTFDDGGAPRDPPLFIVTLPALSVRTLTVLDILKTWHVVWHFPASDTVP